MRRADPLPPIPGRHTFQHICHPCGRIFATWGPELLPKGWLKHNGITYCDRCADARPVRRRALA